MKYLDYRKRLGIGFDNIQLEALFLKRMKNHLEITRTDATFDHLVTSRMVFEYCNITGAEFEDMDTSYCLDSIIEDVIYASDIREFLAKYSVLLYLMKNYRQAYQHFWNILQNNLSEASIQYELVEDDDGMFVFPKGVPEMDNALISEPLSWLTEYPKAHTAYVKALKEYSEATIENASDIADKFRKTLETFFQEFFACDKSLENCKGLYGSYLKRQNVPAEITANFETLLQSYTNFMNGYAKHHDKTSLNVLEYLMYQTGNIIRLLIILRQNELP